VCSCARYILTVCVRTDEETKTPTRVAAPSPRVSLGRRTVCGRMEQHQPLVSKRYETKVRMVWGSFLIAVAVTETPAGISAALHKLR